MTKVVMPASVAALQKQKLAACRVRSLTPANREEKLNEFFRSLMPRQRAILRRLSSRPQAAGVLADDSLLKHLIDYGMVVRVSYADKLMFAGLTEFGLEVITSGRNAQSGSRGFRVAAGVEDFTGTAG